MQLTPWISPSKYIAPLTMLQTRNFSAGRCCRTSGLLGHVFEGLLEVLLAEGELAHGPDLGVLCRVGVVSANHASKRDGIWIEDNPPASGPS